MRKLLILPLVLLLAGCSTINSGTIHNKEYTPAHNIITTSCAPAGKVTVCHPVFIYVPDDYEFDLYRSKDEHGWHEVDAITYHKYRIGDYYSESDN